MNHLISVIIPIYKVEKWLSKCLDSILSQEFLNIEVILVNDGSPDKCGEICEQYAKKDKRIRVLHKENGGLSSARNAGIDIATGKYISFIDPDDIIASDYFNKFFNCIEEYNCEAVISGYKTVPTNQFFVPNFELEKVKTGKEIVLSSSNVHSMNDLCFVWRYMYKLSILKEYNIRFNEEVFIGEDVIFNLEFLLKSNRVYVIPDFLYYYTVNNPTSLMRISYKPNLDSSLILQYKIRKQLSLNYGLLEHEHYKLDMATYYITSIYKMVLKNLKNSSKNDFKGELRKIINYEMFTDSLEAIGFTYKSRSLKEYIYYLALKHKIYPIINMVYQKDSIGSS